MLLSLIDRLLIVSDPGLETLPNAKYTLEFKKVVTVEEKYSPEESAVNWITA